MASKWRVRRIIKIRSLLRPGRGRPGRYGGRGATSHPCADVYAWTLPPASGAPTSGIIESPCPPFTSHGASIRPPFRRPRPAAFARARAGGAAAGADATLNPAAAASPGAAAAGAPLVDSSRFRRNQLDASAAPPGERWNPPVCVRLVAAAICPCRACSCPKNYSAPSIGWLGTGICRCRGCSGQGHDAGTVPPPPRSPSVALSIPWVHGWWRGCLQAGVVAPLPCACLFCGLSVEALTGYLPACMHACLPACRYVGPLSSATVRHTAASMMRRARHLPATAPQ
eukprot:COSAG01_NODE_676_length_14324_cov_17.420105_6_plen_284_part_00